MRTVLPGALASVLLLTTGLRLPALVVSLLLGGLLGLAVGAWGVHRGCRLQRARSGGLYAELLGFGRRLYLAGVIEHLNLYLGSLLVGLHLTARELAFFRLGQDRVQILDQIPSAVNSLLYPRIARMSTQNEQDELAARSIRTLALVLTLCGIAGGILAPFAVWLLYGREYLPMTISIWILLPGICALGMTSPATQYFMGTGQPDAVWKLALVPLVLQVLLLWPLMRAAGFAGAALAISASFVLCACARVLTLARFTGRRPGSLIVPGAAERKFLLEFVRERLPFRGIAHG
jgi:O-antigen/teichoic acid export membrane protein